MAKSPSKKQPATKSATKNSSNQKPQATQQQSSVAADVSLEDLFVSELKDTYWAENHLTKAIPKMIAAAGDRNLKTALTNHLNVTVKHVSRLEKVLEMLGQKLIAKKCDAMEGLTMSGEHVIENTVSGSPTRNLGIIMSGLKVENFEITTYNGLIQVANTLGKPEVADLLQQNLDEEIEASDLLTELSQSIGSN
jgi:ferritin-like metal-binding protein YciE